MKTIPKFSIRARLKSFVYAGRGLWIMLVSQQNAWIHLLASIIVIAAGFYFNLGRTDWCLIILTVVVVWTAEAVNTALEFLADASTPEYDPLVGKAKDVAAGAVLILALGSLVIAAVVFWPHIQKKWFQ